MGMLAERKDKMFSPRHVESPMKHPSRNRKALGELELDEGRTF